jgi:hypothetical protein
MSYWQFRPLNPNDNSGISTVDDNFANEERSSVEILVRETLQNPLDARSNDELVEVRYNLVSVKRDSSPFLESLFSSECLDHFGAGRLLQQEKLPDSIEFLIVEDFGTTGLEGSYTDSSVDGQAENWNAFWFREGEGAKPTRSNGGAGQGKITLYAASAIRSVVALTHRLSDGKQLLFGCCRFKQNYKLPEQSQRWAKEARWGATKKPQELAVPIENEELIAAIKQELGLERGSRPGTSFIVPMPVGITLQDLKKAVVNEFFFPIRRGRLKVTVGEVVLDETSIAAAAASEPVTSGRYTSDYRKFLEGAICTHIDAASTAQAKASWIQDTKLSEKNFDAAQLVVLKTAFEKSELVSVDFPVKIRKKGVALSSGQFRVVLRQHLDGDHSQELFIRQDLSIDGEKRLKGSRRTQPVLALTFIDDVNLSAFLTSAEEPTHRTWNAKRPKVVSLYDGTGPLLTAVRNAALRLVELLTPAGMRDSTALSLYFGDPQSEKPQLRSGTVGVDNQDRGTALPPTVPSISPKLPPPLKPIELLELPDGFVIKAVPSAMATKKLPLRCVVRVAYATTLGDAFKQWDAADFWLNDEKEFLTVTNGITELVKSGNEICFQMDQTDSVFKIHGFDSNRKVEVQINYYESEYAEDIENN